MRAFVSCRPLWIRLVYRMVCDDQFGISVANCIKGLQCFYTGVRFPCVSCVVDIAVILFTLQLLIYIFFSRGFCCLQLRLLLVHTHCPDLNARDGLLCPN